MKCKGVRKYFIPYAEGTLSHSLVWTVEKHLASCEACSRELEEVIETVTVLRETDYPAMEPAFDLRSRVMAQIAREPARRSWWSVRFPAYSAAAAALLLFSVVAFRVDQVYFTEEPRLAQEASAPSPRAAVPKPQPDVMYGLQSKAGSTAVQRAPRSVASPKAAAPKQPVGKHQWADSSAPATSPPSHWYHRDAVPAPSPGRDSDAYEDKAAAVPTRSANAHSLGVESTAMSKGNFLYDLKEATPAETTLNSSTDYAWPLRPPATVPAGPSGPLAYAPEADKTAGLQPNAGAPEGHAHGINQATPGGKQQLQAGEREWLFDFGSAMGNSPTPDDKPLATVTAAVPEAKVSVLERKLRENPTSISTLTDLLDDYRIAGRYKDEYAVAERLTKLDPDNAQYWFRRAQAADRAAMRKTALSAYRQALKLDLTHADQETARARIKALTPQE